MLDHPTLDQLKTLRLDGMAEAFAEMQSQDGTVGSAMLNGWACSLTARRPAVRPNGSKAACARQNCAMLVHRQKTSITKHGAASIKPCSNKC